MSRTFRRFGVVVLAAGLLGSLAVAGASAHPAKANTHMRFHLQDHEVTVGDTVTGPVHLATRSEHHWVPLADAQLSVRVDGTEVATLTTDADGNATVTYVAAEAGEHVVKVVYAGDDTHRRRQRAQGFSATEASG